MSQKGSSFYFVFPGDLNTPTGGYHYDRRLLRELEKQGLTAETISLSDAFPFPDTRALDEARLALETLPEGAVVIIDGLAFGALADLAEAQAHRLRLIALCHHPLALEAGLDDTRRQALRVSEQRALQTARAVVVTSEHTRRLLTTEFAIPRDNITVARPGTDRVSFAPCDGDPPTLLTVASLTRRKAHDVLIDALAPLVSLPWQARFVGGSDFDPAWAASLQAQVKRLDLQERIHFTGAVDNLQTAYQEADMFVLPSRFEGYGMVFAEALAAGLPVIAARAGAVPDVVPESAGILVPVDDPAALSETLHKLLSHEELRRQLQAGARRAAAILPDWRDTARQVAQLVEAVSRS